MTDVPLRCDCGAVSGVARNVSPDTGNHLVCYCKDCQAFARFLERDGDILDEYGGTDIFQMAPAQIRIQQGNEQLRCMRLKPKGLYRWYTNCCRTPVGNTMSAGMPMVGVIHNFMDDEGVRDANLGPVLFYAFGRSAKKTPPQDKNDKGFPFRIILRTIYNLSIARSKGQHKPSPFFNDAGKPVSEPVIPEQA